MHFRDLKIGNKLLLINIISASIAMLVLICCIAIILLISSRDSLIRDVTNQAYMLGESLAAPIAFNDAQSAATLLSTLRWAPYIQQVVAVNNTGQILAAYPQQSSSTDEKDLTIKGYFKEIRVHQPIQMSSEILGEIRINASLDHIYEQLNRFIIFSLIALLLASALGMLMLKRLQGYLTKPIIQLTGFMRQISATNNYSLRFHLENNDELGELANGFNAMLKKIESHQINLDQELSRRKKAENRLHQFAFYDSVTHLPNRHFFKEKLEAAVNAALRYNNHCSVMLIDLDDFKNVNDTLGHHVGDDLLRAVAQRLNQDLRQGDVLCRIGGDEFAMILQNTSSTEQVEFVAERIIKKLSLPFMLAGKEIFIGASIGASFCPNDTTDIPTLLRYADHAMYNAKNHGKNHCLIYKPEMEAKSIKRFTLEHALRRALEQNELFLHYQPVIDIQSDKVFGFEALLRWNNPELGFISPADSIPISEEIGLIIPIGEFVLHTACMQMQQWKQRYAFEGTISINLSGRQLIDSNVVNKIVTIVESSKLPFHSVCIELTESILMDHSKETLSKLEKLNRLGFLIAIDDFGTGYSSMNYLKRYPLDSLKIDRSFIADLPHQVNDIAITKAIIALGKSLGMKIIAEGVENNDQLELLKTLQCDMVQGRYYGETLTTDQAEQFIAARFASISETKIPH